MRRLSTPTCSVLVEILEKTSARGTPGEEHLCAGKVAMLPGIWWGLCLLGAGFVDQESLGSLQV